MKSYLKGNIDENVIITDLAAATLVSSDFDETPEQDTLVSSIVASYSIDNLVAGQGPLIFGVAHSDYSDAEIEEFIENTGSWDQGSKVEQERAKRLIRKIGTMVGTQGSGTVDVKWNNGVPMKTKLNWRLNTGDTLNLWCYNISASALSTSTPVLRAHGHANLWMI